MIDNILGFIFMCILCTIMVAIMFSFSSCTTLACYDYDGNRIECKPPHYEKY